MCAGNECGQFGVGDAETLSQVLVIGAVRDFPGGIERWLQAHGAEPHHCADACSACALAAAEDFMLVMVDAMDVEVDGLFAELRAYGQPGTFVCLGRNDNLDEEARALRAGADLFVPRPLCPETIGLALARSQPLLLRPLPLCGPLFVIPARHEVVAPGVSSFLSDAEYELLLFVAETPKAWRPLQEARELFHWGLSEVAAAGRLKDLARRLRQKLGPYGPWLVFDRHRGVCLREPQ